MKLYVRRNWQYYIPFARDTLYEILNKDYAHEVAMGVYTEAAVDEMKREVYEVVLIDSGFKQTPSPAVVN